MNVSRDVVVDLLPLYLAGEASADTRELIEGYMKEHADFAAEMRARVERGAAVFGAASAPAPPDQEKATLERVRRFNRNRTYWLGFAIAYTLISAGKAWWWGIVFALFLEGMMVTLYPGWLRVPLTTEFLTLSVSGHFIYGSILGVLARRAP